eukprot:TRINITY_DN67_c0_g1_i5.p1 TRINITY_DN67_c0_g1~~TRINITY_DN67_c0_g1_i5.p1  ORF type:complete len:674 (-),score=255.61 TRINITY_DN67_c0_g1_i5:158-2179(-)
MFVNVDDVTKDDIESVPKEYIVVDQDGNKFDARQELPEGEYYYYEDLEDDYENEDEENEWEDEYGGENQQGTLGQEAGLVTDISHMAVLDDEEEDRYGDLEGMLEEEGEGNEEQDQGGTYDEGRMMSQAERDQAEIDRELEELEQSMMEEEYASMNPEDLQSFVRGNATVVQLGNMDQGAHNEPDPQTHVPQEPVGFNPLFTDAETDGRQQDTTQSTSSTGQGGQTVNMQNMQMEDLLRLIKLATAQQRMQEAVGGSDDEATMQNDNFGLNMDQMTESQRQQFQISSLRSQVEELTRAMQQQHLYSVFGPHIPSGFQENKLPTALHLAKQHELKSEDYEMEGFWKIDRGDRQQGDEESVNEKPEAETTSTATTTGTHADEDESDSEFLDREEMEYERKFAGKLEEHRASIESLLGKKTNDRQDDGQGRSGEDINDQDSVLFTEYDQLHLEHLQAMEEASFADEGNSRLSVVSNVSTATRSSASSRRSNQSDHSQGSTGILDEDSFVEQEKAGVVRNEEQLRKLLRLRSSGEASLPGVDIPRIVYDPSLTEDNDSEDSDDSMLERYLELEEDEEASQGNNPTLWMPDVSLDDVKEVDAQADVDVHFDIEDMSLDTKQYLLKYGLIGDPILPSGTDNEEGTITKSSTSSALAAKNKTKTPFDQDKEIGEQTILPK